jgi:glutathione S-transferase
MATARPQLITFAASHFCEKARWALDWHGISYEEVGWPPGLHQILAKRRGLKEARVPIVFDGDDVVQGSGAIVDWADRKDPNPDRTLTPKTEFSEASEIENRVGDVIGVHVRRWEFAQLLPAHAHVVKSALFHGATGWRRIAGNMMWPVSRRVMVRAFDIVPGASEDSRSRLEKEFDWLEEKLADGRTYFVGDRFSRADLTVASLLAHFARPNELAIHHTISGSDSFAAVVDRWSKRPIMRWVRSQYEMHRAC